LQIPQRTVEVKLREKCVRREGAKEMIEPAQKDAFLLFITDQESLQDAAQACERPRVSSPQSECDATVIVQGHDHAVGGKRGKKWGEGEGVHKTLCEITI
jgi:hypothetical protein